MQADLLPQKKNFKFEDLITQTVLERCLLAEVWLYMRYVLEKEYTVYKYNSTASTRQNKSKRLLKEKLPIFAYHILYFSLNAIWYYLF